MNDSIYPSITPIGVVFDFDRFLFCYGLEQWRKERHTLQFLVFIEANDWLRTGTDSFLKMGTHFFDPFKARHTLETAKHGNGLRKLGYLFFIQRRVKNREVRVFIAIPDFTTASDLLHHDMPTVLNG